MGYTPISIDKKAPGLSMSISIGRKKPKPGEMAALTRQFATMIGAGLTLMRSLGVLADQAENQHVKTALLDVKGDVEKGASLSQAMQKHPKIFGRLYVAMVRAGEASGALEDVLLQLATTLEKQMALRQKVRSAMTYPVAVFGLVAIICIAMLAFVVPMFEKLYDRLGGSLPTPTQILLSLSNGFLTFFPFVIVFLIVGIVGLKKWLKTTNGRLKFDTLKLRLPIVGDLIHKTALARFTRSLAVLLRTGVPILDALEITADTAGNARITLVVRDAKDRVRAGDSLSHVLGESPLFPKIVTQMMAVGEETGALDNLIDKVANFYEDEVEAKVAALTSLLEPALIVFMGGSVGGMVVSLYLPMFNVIKLVNKQG